jgi:hypothetical protein
MDLPVKNLSETAMCFQDVQPPLQSTEILYISEFCFGILNSPDWMNRDYYVHIRENYMKIAWKCSFFGQ